MPLYKYKAISRQGRVLRGLLEAISIDAATDILEDRNLTIIMLGQSEQKPMNIRIPFIGRVRRKSVVIFSRQLSVMLSATVPVVQALRILTVQTDDKAFKTVLADMADDVDGGMKLSSAFAKHPDVFSDFYVAMLRSGETSGRLDKVLNYLAAQSEKDYQLTSKIKGAMVYPAFILSALVAVGFIMMIFVVPRMTELLQETGTELPFMTRALVGISDFLVSYWWLLILGIFGAIGGLQAFIRSIFGRKQWDMIKLRIPIFGSLFKKIIISRFATSLSTLIKGGVPISRALVITGDVVSNQAFKAIIDDTVHEVEDGNSITTALNKNKLIPTMVPQMMSVGEKTGRMDEVLDRLGDFYAQEVDTMISSLTSLIEPMIMIILGVGVGLMVSAIIMPMFQIANSIS